MSDINKKLDDLGIVIPEPAAAVGSYLPVSAAGKMLFLSGQLPSREGKVLYTGKVPHDLTLDQAVQAARLCLINALSQLKASLGTLDTIESVVKVEVFVNSYAGFTDQAKVANGASDLLQEIFGEAGRHARTAVGVSELPLNAAVELAMIVMIK